MNLPALGNLAVSDLKASGARSWVSIVGIGIGASVLMLVVALGLGVRGVVLREVVRELPIDFIEVTPKSLDFGLFKTGGLFGDTAIKPATLQQLRSIEGVVEAHPKLNVAIPMGARGGARLFGRQLYTDLFMRGVPTALIAPEAPDFVDHTDFIPVVISDQLIEVFNGSVAPALGIPKLTAQTLKGFAFDISFGRSLMLGARGAGARGIERAKIVGVSRHALRLGVTVPMETARRLIAKYGPAADPSGVAEERPEERYSAVVLRADSAAAIPFITSEVEALGQAVDESADQARNILTAGATLGALVGILVLFLAALNIAHGFYAVLSERRRELAIMRSVGARRRDLVALVLFQAAFLGGAGGLVGIVVSRLVGMAVDASAVAWLPDFPFKPETFFSFSMGLDALGFFCAVAAAMAGAFLPAMHASRTSVSRSLAG